MEDQSGEVVAFYFSVPDIYSNDRVLIIKTMGVAPKYQSRGIGGALFYSIHQAAKKQGFKKYIFSTIKDDNKKIQKLAYSEKVYRKYGVYEMKFND